MFLITWNEFDKFLEPAIQFSFAGLVNLSNLPNLKAFSLYAVVICKPPRKRLAPRSAPPFAVLHDINIVLGTIPKSNKLTNLWFHFVIFDQRPFRGCLKIGLEFSMKSSALVPGNFSSWNSGCQSAPLMPVMIVFLKQIICTRPFSLKDEIRKGRYVTHYWAK